METIRVYHSLWKSVLLVTCSFGFAALGFYSIIYGNDRIIIWLCTLFFVIGGLFMLLLMLKERITRTPYYLITDDSIIISTGLKTYQIHFADVECFYLTKVGPTKGRTTLIGIQYKKDVQLRENEDAEKAGRAIRRFNKIVPRIKKAIPAECLTIKPKDLCEILNERVILSRNI